jgi:predicted helicase
MPCKIYYFSLTDEQTKTEKLEWFKNTKLQDIDFQLIKPDKNANWINLTDNDFESLIPVCSKDAKLGKGGNAIFELFSLGVVTARDEWVYDFSKENLAKKIQFFIETYNSFLSKITSFSKDVIFDKNADEWDASIKWSEYLKGIFKRKQKITFDEKLLVKANDRPFTNKFYYAEKFLSDRLTQNHYDIFGDDLAEENKVICFSGISSSKNFQCLVVNEVFSLDFLEKTNCLPLYRYENGEKRENITDWALELFRKHYEKITSTLDLEITSFEKDVISKSNVDVIFKPITKTDIFHYVYAVLHKPEYRTKYEQNLKREFPRIPLYDDFWKYAEAGKKLMELHINYDKDVIFSKDDIFTPLLQRKDIDLEVFKATKQGKKKKISEIELTFFEKDVNSTAPFTVYPILKIKDGNIEIDELTTLCGVPAEALAYKLGNRSAIEWVLEQYKPYKSDDKTIQEQFNNYNFEDYKEQVIDLLQKVTWVSVETMKIVKNL